jgi:hypothetical protein
MSTALAHELEVVLRVRDDEAVLTHRNLQAALMIMLSVLTAHWQAAVSLRSDSAGQAPYHRGLVRVRHFLRISVTRRRQADYKFHCEFQFCNDPDADFSVSKALRNAASLCELQAG